MESVHFGYTHPTFAIAVPNSAAAIIIIIIIAPTEGTKSSHPVNYDSAAGMRLVYELRILTTN